MTGHSNRRIIALNYNYIQYGETNKVTYYIVSYFPHQITLELHNFTKNRKFKFTINVKIIVRFYLRAIHESNLKLTRKLKLKQQT